MARAVAKRVKRAHGRERQMLDQVVAGAARLHRSGNTGDAASLYERILAVWPDHFDALHLLGVIRQQQSRSAEALALIDAALRLVPDSADALANRGVVLKGLDRLDEALASYDAALAINPDQFDALVNRARLLLLLGRHEDALQAANAALARRADDAVALRCRSHALLQLERPAEALADYDRVLALLPDDVEALNNRAIALNALRRHEDALLAADRALAIDPGNVSVLVNRGNALSRLKRFDDALSCYDRALALCPAHADALHNRGVALVELNRYDEALACYERALAVKPDMAEIRYSQALALLTVGDYRSGWDGYEWRWKSPRWNTRQRHFAEPQWRGDAAVDGKTILLHAEQGFGDTLQFVRYAPLVARKGARVIVEVPQPLKALLRQLEQIEILARGEMLPAFDLHCPLMSLPFAFGTELSTIPAAIPYLGVPQDRIGRWRDRLGERRCVRVGVVWAGSALHEDNPNRSVPLGRFARILSIPGIEFVSLQRDLTLEDAAQLSADTAVVDAGDDLVDFADAAALISLLDIVVSVDTAAAHLAGAMGKRVLILLPFSPDFRWLLDRDDSPWYPTARLFRQTAPGDWNGPLADVRDALMAMVRCG